MIYRIKYASESSLKTALETRGVLVPNEEGDVTFDRECWGEGVESIVVVGKIVDVPATLDAEGNVVTEATFVNGYHADIMGPEGLDFGSNLETPSTPVHKWAGESV